MNKTFVKIIMLACLIGIGLSSYLLVQHFELAAHPENKGESFCSINATIDCDAVALSPYATFFSIPMAGLGLFYYLVVLFYAIISIGSPKHKHRLAFCFYLSLVSLAITLVMAGISFFKLGALCLFCMGMYVVNLAITILFPYALDTSWSEFIKFTNNYISALFNTSYAIGFKPRFIRHSVFTLAIFGMGSLIVHQVGQNLETPEPAPQAKTENKPKTITETKSPKEVFTLDDLIKLHFEQAAFAIDATGRPHWGNPNADIVILDFSDFECPHCRLAGNYLKPALKDFEEVVVLYYMNYPLDKNCNPYMMRDLHQNACLASQATLCADKKGKFWQLHDAVFENQKSLSLDKILELGKGVGLNANWLKNCMQSDDVNKMIAADIELGKKVGVRGTPTIFVNGRKLRSWSNQKILHAILDEELARSQ